MFRLKSFGPNIDHIYISCKQKYSKKLEDKITEGQKLINENDGNIRYIFVEKHLAYIHKFLDSNQESMADMNYNVFHHIDQIDKFILKYCNSQFILDKMLSEMDENEFNHLLKMLDELEQMKTRYPCIANIA